MYTATVILVQHKPQDVNVYGYGDNESGV